MSSALTAVWQLMTPAGRVDPYPLYDAIREAGPVAALDGGFVAVTGHAQVDQILRDPSFIVRDHDAMDREWPGWRARPSIVAFRDSMLLVNSPGHERVRRLVSRAFTARRVAQLRDAVQGLVSGLCDRLEAADGPVDFMSEFAFLLPVTVIGELLGVPLADRAWFRPLIGELTIALEMISEASELDGADAAVLQLNDYFVDLVEQRRRDPQDDLISALVTARDEGPERLSQAELLGNLVLLFAAGFETTTNLLGNGLSVLLAQPQIEAALRADPGLVPAFVDETLRFDSPVQVTGRRATRAVEIGGTEVPAGAATLLLLGAANRDPSRFDVPDSFRLDRHDNQPLSFGGGVHYCLGAPLARLEAQVAFTTLLERFATIAPAGPTTRRDRLTLRGFETLPVSVTASGD